MTNGLWIKTLTLGPLDTNCYLVAAGGSVEAIVIDPAAAAPAIVSEARESNLKIAWIVLTHGHFDHAAGAGELHRLTGAGIGVHSADAPMLAGAVSSGAAWLGYPFDPCSADFTIEDGQTIEAGALALRAIHTPGHTPGGLSLYAEGAGGESGAVFSGDALFFAGIGRTDLPGGDGRLLVRSIREKLFSLPADTRVFPGHGPETTIGREKKDNPFVGDGA